ncbi:MAG: preprotein translocase subunit SecY [Saprospiraceae bacterium]|nr:preprotein translocase subunit SecY [Saprospiraceae bacterium]
MKKFIETLKNIWKIEDLRNRILYTLGLLLIFRVGTFITLPGVDPVELKRLVEANGTGGLLGLFNTFAGGAFYRAGIFALGIMPYISASIVMQLLTLVVPTFQKIQKDGESGRRKINQYTRFLTVVITAFQAIAYVAFLKSGQSGLSGAVDNLNGIFPISTLIILTAGTLFVMWLGEKITDGGIGNGVSLLITVGIIAGLPSALIGEFSAKTTSGGGALVFFIELLFLLGVVLVTIALVQATRKIPVQYAKRMVGRGGKMAEVGGARQFIPLKLNASGVMPIIFAQALMFLPSTIAGFVGGGQAPTGILAELSNPFSLISSVLTFFLVVIFTYFYTALIINPNQMADDMKKNGGFIPGVRPGKKTASFIEGILDRITLPGSIFLGLIAILPTFAQLAGVNANFALFYGGTSLLIMVAVVLDTLQQIESHLLMRHYDGLMKSGKSINKGGRSRVGASV